MQLAQTVKKASQNFCASKNKVKTIFGRGVHVAKNTSQTASVEIVRRRRTISAHSRLRKTGGKPRRGFSPRSGQLHMQLALCVYYSCSSICFSSS